MLSWSAGVSEASILLACMQSCPTTVQVRVGSTNIHQSCLAAYASKAVVGAVVGVVVGGGAACAAAILGLVVVVRQQRRRLASLQRCDHSSATSPKGGAAAGASAKLSRMAAPAVGGRNASRSKLLSVLPPSLGVSGEEGDYIRVPAQTPGPRAAIHGQSTAAPLAGGAESPPRPAYFVAHEHGSPSPAHGASGEASPERRRWQVRDGRT